MGRVVEVIDTSGFEKYVEKVSRRAEEEEHQAERLTESPSFRLCWMAKKYDDWFLDPLVGFIIPGVGDIISSAATFPAVYVALFKIRSLKLTMAILATMVLDLLCGLVPGIGDLCDAFYKSSKIACRLIVGYMDKDPATMEEINRRALWGTVGAIAAGLLLWLVSSFILKIVHWIGSLF